MKLEDIFVKCDSYTLDFLKKYIVFIYRITNNGKLRDEYKFSLGVTTYEDIKSAEIFYFIVLILFSDLNLKRHLLKLGISERIEQNAASDLYDNIRGINNLQDSELVIMYNILRLDEILEILISNEKEKICLERMLINLIRMCKFDTENISIVKNLGVDKALPFLERLASSKELVIPTSQKVVAIGGSVLGGGSVRKEVCSSNNDDIQPFINSNYGDTLELKDEKHFIRGISINSQREDNLSRMVDIPYTVNLTKRTFKEDPVVGRKKEIRQFGASLLDEEKSVILYGKPGVGKTTLVRGLAYQIQHGIAHEDLNGYQIFETSAARLISGTGVRGSFEKKMLELIDRIIKLDKAFLYIDEIHAIVGAGSSQISDNTVDATEILKPYLGDGSLKIIGGTTDLEYGKVLASAAFARRFIDIEIPELSGEEVRALLNKKIEQFQDKYRIGFGYPEDVKREILNVYLELSQDQYQNAERRLYNPDLSLTLLRMAYNFARYDKKANIDAYALIEGLEMIKEVNQEGREHFISRVRQITK